MNVEDAAQLFDRADQLGFKQVDADEPMLPFACLSCGALVSACLFAVHVGVCPGRA